MVAAAVAVAVAADYGSGLGERRRAMGGPGIECSGLGYFDRLCMNTFLL